MSKNKKTMETGGDGSQFLTMSIGRFIHELMIPEIRKIAQEIGAEPMFDLPISERFSDEVGAGLYRSFRALTAIRAKLEEPGQ